MSEEFSLGREVACASSAVIRIFNVNDILNIFQEEHLKLRIFESFEK